jgi:DNA-binding NarL/FixJ family response regulator
MSAPVRIVLADDHNVVRQALRLLLETETRFTVVGEAADGLEAVALAERLRPDLLVVDLMLPGLNGIDVARHVTKRAASRRVLVLSMHMTEAHVLDALRSGVRGYVRKDASASDLLRAVAEVSDGHLYLSPPFSDKAIEAYRERAERAASDPYEQLTAREREVLQLAAEGRGNTEIGKRLGVSPRTVESHRAALKRKLGLAREADVVRYAIRRGLVPLDFDPDATPRR